MYSFLLIVFENIDTNWEFNKHRNLNFGLSKVKNRNLLFQNKSSDSTKNIHQQVYKAIIAAMINKNNHGPEAFRSLETTHLRNKTRTLRGHGINACVITKICLNWSPDGLLILSFRTTRSTMTAHKKQDIPFGWGTPYNHLENAPVDAKYCRLEKVKWPRQLCHDNNSLWSGLRDSNVALAKSSKLKLIVRCHLPSK